MYRKPYDLVAVGIAALLAMAVILGDWPLEAPRVVAGIALVFLLPGYAIAALLTPRLPTGGVESWLVVVGLSLAITVLGALILHLTPWGLQTSTWALWLAGVTVIASGLAVGQARPAASAASRRRLPRLSEVALLGAAAALGVLAFFSAYSGAQQMAAPNATQLWLLEAEPGSQADVRVGIQNLEGGPRTYRLVVRSAGRVLREWPSLTIAAGERWENDVRLAGGASPAVEALLYVGESDAVYRRAVLRGVALDSSLPAPLAFGGPLASIARQGG